MHMFYHEMFKKKKLLGVKWRKQLMQISSTCESVNPYHFRTIIT
jgi:hypothetical protein